MTKFATDLIWTYGALTAMAASGFLMNLVVGIHYGAEGLGTFNQALALFVIVSQLSAFGFHLSVFKSVAEFSNERETVDTIVSSGLVLSVVSGLAFSILLFMLAEPIGALLSSDGVAESLRRLAPALFLFNINKVLLSTLNAVRQMRRHAIGQIVRYTSLLLVVLWTSLASSDIVNASYCFLVAELILLVFLVCAIRGLVTPSLSKVRLVRLRECLHFGVRGVWSGMAAELNIRTDILVIGLFLSDAQVGVYAFASVIFEGVINAIYAIRLNLNATLVGIIKARDWPAMHFYMEQVFRWLYPAAVGIYILVAALFLPAVGVVFGQSDFAQGYLPLLILLAPLVLVAGILPFDQALLQAGHAGHYSIALALTFLVNLGLNLLLVPQWGLSGAAAATGTALLAGVAYFIYMAGRILQWNAGAYLFSRLRSRHFGTHGR